MIFPCRLVVSSILCLDWTLFIFLGVAFIFTLFIPETLAPVLLRRKAEKLRKDTGDARYCTLEELEKTPLAEAMKVALIRPFLMLFQEPIVIFFSICKCMADSLSPFLTTFIRRSVFHLQPSLYVILMWLHVPLLTPYYLPDLMFFAFPIAFSEVRGFSAGLTGLTFISIMVCFLLSLQSHLTYDIRSWVS